MRVLLVMDPLIPVPPRHYGGIERVIADLDEGLTARGHSVTLWAAPGSHSEGTLETFGQEGEWTRWSNVRNTMLIAHRFWQRAAEFDVVHNFGRLAYLVSIFRRNLPKVQTYMRRVNPRNVRRAAALGAKRLHYTAVSAAIRATGAPGGGEWSIIHNCASPSRYTYNGNVDLRTAPLVFLGRLERCKGAHAAIEVARRLNRRLVIAGNVSTLPEEAEYFHKDVEPLIDGSLVTYMGPVDDQEKDKLLGSAAALLLPVEWLEPFPVVLPEALMCGTPVVGFRRGGVPEGIDHGRTGFVCDDIDGMVAAIQRLGEIDRAVCREEGSRRFSQDAIVSAYETLYWKLSRPGVN